MKLNFNTVLMDVRDGKELTTKKQVEDKFIDEVLTLGTVAAEGLGAVFQDEQGKLTSKEKLRRGLLIEQIYTRPESEVSIEEAALIEERIGRMYGPIVVVAAKKVMDPQVSA